MVVSRSKLGNTTQGIHLPLGRGDEMVVTCDARSVDSEQKWYRRVLLSFHDYITWGKIRLRSYERTSVSSHLASAFIASQTSARCYMSTS